PHANIDTLSLHDALPILDNRLTATAEYYNSETRDVLTGMQISMTTGNQGGAPLANVASLKNTGFELGLMWRDQVGEFNYNVGTKDRKSTRLNSSHVKISY